jgi:hypothetical protein
VCLLSVSGVLAYSLSIRYWDTNPLEMYPGETKIVNPFTLSHSIHSPEVENVVVSLEEDAGIAEIIGETHSALSVENRDFEVITKITIPANAVVGLTHNLLFSIETDKPNAGSPYFLSIPVVIKGIDNDNDGFFQPSDCDDNNPNINPDTTEICDLIDNDCDGIVDNVDADSDGVNDCIDDKCLGTTLIGNVPITETWGCGILQILECKPGESQGQIENNINPGILNVFINQKGWSQNGICFDN